VEDDAIIGLAESRALQREGFAVETVSTGERAVEYVRTRSGPLDLVLMDIDLGPGMDGASAAMEILALKDLPILFLSSHTEQEVVEKSERISSYGYVVKNSGLVVLLASIKMALKLHRADRAARDRERRLAENESRLRFALEGTNDGLWDVLLLTGEVYLSPRDCEILGYGHNEAAEIYKVWNQLVHPDDLPETVARLEDHLSGKAEIFEVEQRLHTKSGNWKWIYTRGKVVDRAADGTALRMTGTHTDISERKRVQAELRESEALFSAFMENIPALVYFKDDTGRSIRLSRTFETFLGRPLEEIVGKDLEELFPSDIARKMAEDDLRVLREGRRVESLETVGDRVYSTTKFPIRDEDGKAFIAGFSIDVTERERAKAELEALLAEKEALLSRRDSGG